MHWTLVLRMKQSAIANLVSSDLAATIGKMEGNDRAMDTIILDEAIANLESSGVATTIGNMEINQVEDNIADTCTHTEIDLAS